MRDNVPSLSGAEHVARLEASLGWPIPQREQAIRKLDQIPESALRSNLAELLLRAEIGRATRDQRR